LKEVIKYKIKQDTVIFRTVTEWFADNAVAVRWISWYVILWIWGISE